MSDKASKESLIEARHIVRSLNHRAELDGVSQIREDSDETNMLALALEQMRSQVFEEKFENLRARRIIPAGGGDIDPGAETYAHEYTTEAGEAAITTNYSDDPPAVETSSVKVPAGIVGVQVAHHFTVQDMRRAAMTGRPLQSRKLAAGRRAYERKMDEIAAVGAPEYGIPDGICNRDVGTDSDQIRYSAVADANDWKDSSRDPVAMLEDLNSWVRGYTNDCDDQFTPRLVSLPPLHELAVRQTRMSDLTDTTVLQAFLSANPSIRDLVPWRKLRLIDGASGNVDRGLLLQDTTDVLELIIPQDFELFALEQIGLRFRQIGHGRTGGTSIHQPLGIRYLTGLPTALS